MYPHNLIENSFIPYSFNGMEKDDEVKGEGNSYTTFFRQYDPRLGRWFCVDPEAHVTATQSPYNSMGNNPIMYNDPFGDYIRYGVYGQDKRELKATIREARHNDPNFNQLYKDWKKDKEQHTLFSGDMTDRDITPDKGAQQDEIFPFIWTNSDRNVSNRNGEGEVIVIKKPKLFGGGIKEVSKVVNKTVTNHHHYISNPSFEIETETIDIEFQNQSNQLLTDLDPINDYINGKNVIKLSTIYGTSAPYNERNKKSKNNGFIINGVEKRNTSIKQLLKERKKVVEGGIDRKINSDEFKYSGKGRSDGERIKSSITITSIKYL